MGSTSSSRAIAISQSVLALVESRNSIRVTWILLLLFFEAVLSESWHSLVLVRELERSERPVEIRVDHGLSVDCRTHFWRFRCILVVVKCRLFSCSARWLTLRSFHFRLFGLFQSHDWTVAMLLVFENCGRGKLTDGLGFLRAVKARIVQVLSVDGDAGVEIALIVFVGRLPLDSSFELRFGSHVRAHRTIEIVGAAVGVSEVLSALMAAFRILTLILISQVRRASLNRLF